MSDEKEALKRKASGVCVIRVQGSKLNYTRPGQSTCVCPSSAIPTLSCQSTKPYEERPRLPSEAAETCLAEHSLIVVHPIHPGLPGNSNMSVYSFYIFDRHSEFPMHHSHVNIKADPVQPNAYTPSDGPKLPSSVIPPPTRSAMATCPP
jgi:hypothetical protein